jgi:hypothetical protein
VAENDGKWRFLEGSRRHFAVLRAGCGRLQSARLVELTFTESGCLAPRPARHVASGAPFFAGRGTKRLM